MIINPSPGPQGGDKFKHKAFHSSISEKPGTIATSWWGQRLVHVEKFLSCTKHASESTSLWGEVFFLSQNMLWKKVGKETELNWKREVFSAIMFAFPSPGFLWKSKPDYLIGANDLVDFTMAHAHIQRKIRGKWTFCHFLATLIASTNGQVICTAWFWKGTREGISSLFFPLPPFQIVFSVNVLFSVNTQNNPPKSSQDGPAKR